MSAKLSTFRVHYVGGDVMDVDAETPEQARKIAVVREAGIITKIKVKRS